MTQNKDSRHLNMNMLSYLMSDNFSRKITTTYNLDLNR